jgi:cyclophilin family peptidyl-prolyl cis-trans isomerase/HEAT repeat protein
MLTLRAEVLRAEDRRIVDDALLAAAVDPSAEIRALAARALGRIGDPAGGERLAALLVDGDAGVRAEAAFALGLMGDVSAIDALSSAAGDVDPLVRARAADALGLLEEPAAAATLAGMLEDDDSQVVTAACYAVTRLEGVDVAVDPLLRVYEERRAEVGFPALNALSRLASRPLAIGPEKKMAVRQRMIELSRSDSSLVRVLAAQGLNAPQSSQEAEALAVLTEDPDPMVRVRAVGSFAFPGAPLEPFVSRALKDPDDRVVLAAVQALGRMRGPDILEALANVVVNDSRLWLRRQAIVTMGRVDAEGAAAMANGLSKSEEPELREATARLLHDRTDGASMRVALRLFQDPDPRVRDAAIPALAGAAGLLSSQLGDLVEETADRTRIAITVAAGRRVADPRSDDEQVSDALDLLELIWRSPLDPPRPRVRIALLDAAAAAGELSRAHALLVAGLDSADRQVRLRAIEHLREVFGEDFSARAGAATERPLEDYREVLRWAERPRAARVVVERPGFLPDLFTLQLDTSATPLTSRSFWQLAERGFYDGLVIHRLVPNFVVQGGDPEGDGSGGPGYTIRDEFHASLFMPGTLGMASSGKDTAGSQWFITLLPQPRFSGRYTPFGRVVQNFPGVVSLLLPGDRVVRVEVYEGDGSEPLPPVESLFN